jgi:hypothetical protein
MIRPAFLLAATLVALPAHGAATAATPPPAACEVPADLVAPAQPLRNLGRSLQPGGRLDVLALGSGTLLGPRGGVDGSVPDHMLKELHDAAPGVGLYLFLHGARAETATAMLAAMRKEFSTHSYQLVLWQTGTVEAVRKLPLAQFRDTLGAGATAAAVAGADLVLIDVPYSRLLDANSDLQPYRAAMRDLADTGKVVLFRRYDLMRHWAETGVLDMEAAGKHEQHSAADRLRARLGEALAKLVLAARGQQE